MSANTLAVLPFLNIDRCYAIYLAPDNEEAVYSNGAMTECKMSNNDVFFRSSNVNALRADSPRHAC